MKKIGITGTIASGKSTVSILLRRHGIPVFDSDGYAKLCLNGNHSASAKIIETFGTSICDSSGQIDRKLLAKEIFGHEEQRQKLNAIVHPFVKEGLLNFFHKHESSPLVAGEVPLLFECGWQDLFDEIVVVTCSDPVAISRMVEDRGYSLQEARDRLASQMNLFEQIKQADKIIYNNGTLVELNENVEAYLRGEL